MTVPDRVVVVGGGISGLAAAHRLAERGLGVTVLEADDRLGGLGTFFQHRGVWLERHAHCVLPGDTRLLPLMDELGVGVRWAATSTGVALAGQRRRLASVRDLLHLRVLTPRQRVRSALVSARLRRRGRRDDLDDVRTADWLRDLYGDAVWNAFLRPLVEARFGPGFADVPALALWRRLHRERGSATRGYPEGGYKAVVAALRHDLERLGGVVRLSTPVRRLETGGPGIRLVLGDGPDGQGSDGEVLEAEWAVATVPPPVLAALAGGELRRRLPRDDVRYQGVVSAVFFLRRPLDGHYRTTVLHAGTEFDGVVEMSALAGPETYGGRHVAYAVHYADSSSPVFAEDESAIAERWTAQLLGLYPDRLDSGDVEAVRVFRAPVVEPVHPLGAASRRPPSQVPGTALWLATSAQVYPEVTSWDASLGLARSVADALADRVGVRERLLRDVPTQRRTGSGPDGGDPAPSEP